VDQPELPVPTETSNAFAAEIAKLPVEIAIAELMLKK